jgi:hypothetical protein
MCDRKYKNRYLWWYHKTMPINACMSINAPCPPSSDAPPDRDFPGTRVLRERVYEKEYRTGKWVPPKEWGR